MKKVLCLVVLAVAGCGGNQGRIAVVSTTGSMTMEDKPAAGALLVFHPVAEPSSLPANPRARVLADGSFVVETYDAKDGAPVGEYVVTVEWRIKPSEEGNEEDKEGASEKSLVSEQYTKPESSPIKVRVAPGSDGRCELPPIRINRPAD